MATSKATNPTPNLNPPASAITSFFKRTITPTSERDFSLTEPRFVGVDKTAIQLYHDVETEFLALKKQAKQLSALRKAVEAQAKEDEAKKKKPVFEQLHARFMAASAEVRDTETQLWES